MTEERFYIKSEFDKEYPVHNVLDSKGEFPRIRCLAIFRTKRFVEKLNEQSELITTLKGGYDEYEEIIGELKAENNDYKSQIDELDGLLNKYEITFEELEEILEKRRFE